MGQSKVRRAPEKEIVALLQSLQKPSQRALSKSSHSTPHCHHLLHVVSSAQDNSKLIPPPQIQAAKPSVDTSAHAAYSHPHLKLGKLKVLYRVFHFALSGLPSLSPLKENKETTRWPKISLFSPYQGLLWQGYQEPWVASSQLYIILLFFTTDWIKLLQIDKQ